MEQAGKPARCDNADNRERKCQPQCLAHQVFDSAISPGPVIVGYHAGYGHQQAETKQKGQDPQVAAHSDGAQVQRTDAACHYCVGKAGGHLCQLADYDGAS